MKKLLIIGGVAAGATAAAKARRLDETAEITILEAGNDVSFANCGLPYYIGGDIQYRSSLILQSPEAFWDQYRVRVYTGTEALAIDRQAKKVLARRKDDDTTAEYAYDSLILAQGGKPIVPALPGVDRPNVFQLWTLDDMDAIDNFIKQRQPRRAVVVGGGFIGLEMVEALVQRGLRVSVVELAPQIMPNLELELAGFLTKELQAHGVELHLGKALAGIGDGSVSLNDGSSLLADLVLLSVGVRPTLNLAKAAALAIGPSGALVVNDYLQTEDPAIFAAGDMVEISHRLHGKKLRVPLAGPANRQGRIVAVNALGGRQAYHGTTITSIVKLFDAQAGSTGLSVAAAKAAGFDAEAVVTHKVNHTYYYPGATPVSLMLVYDKASGRVLGAQAAGFDGVDKRLDVMATALVGQLTIDDLAELDLAYAPPFNSPNGPVNMAAFTAQNRRSGFSPALTAAELEAWLATKRPQLLDVRDPIQYAKWHLPEAVNIGLGQLRDQLGRLDCAKPLLVLSDDGQKGHLATRLLLGRGFSEVRNLSGGLVSLENYARAGGLKQLALALPSVEAKATAQAGAAAASGAAPVAPTTLAAAKPAAAKPAAGSLVIDVRTPGEFRSGAFPGAINIPLDDLPDRAGELAKDRDIVLYCASGARSAYGQRILRQLGFSRVRNAGGLADIMAEV
ncbi:MAG: CoA-disulfide reductase [Spirochaetes bacterium GWD1_61_31]|nr:MAG: CoA-disulfide reductase [Spirochaetes bacterium GWB1_60_80]OHD35316.1 MAG: CoA-disulfide reductase [Spirochaetes bacterium GWC1_61_12]OHD37297.1 MAG: CoA-disulfide reductase [Spirochaetes bacterium GWD1_61_31]OHD44972.1 MAG: CoA-disulfide reductase [Spirochaetes bacterium GWE1_60_18]OHD60081.1 MAG: CoA-disulfide reductase [Spirochaetes bacterium GWF1_60_12]HAP43647.1 CoA-disulfide reductase [Spirochaetaceae bacterium]